MLASCILINYNQNNNEIKISLGDEKMSEVEKVKDKLMIMIRDGMTINEECKDISFQKGKVWTASLILDYIEQLDIQ